MLCHRTRHRRCPSARQCLQLQQFLPCVSPCQPRKRLAKRTWYAMKPRAPFQNHYCFGKVHSRYQTIPRSCMSCILTHVCCVFVNLRRIPDCHYGAPEAQSHGEGVCASRERLPKVLAKLPIPKAGDFKRCLGNLIFPSFRSIVHMHCACMHVPCCPWCISCLVVMVFVPWQE